MVTLRKRLEDAKAGARIGIETANRHSRAFLVPMMRAILILTLLGFLLVLILSFVE